MTETKLTNTPPPQETHAEMGRYQIFVGIQLFFLLVSLITGGFNFKVWSMLDSAILIVSIGVTGLLFVLEETSLRKTIFYTAIVLYLLAVIDMAANILISGAVGWRDL